MNHIKEGSLPHGEMITKFGIKPKDPAKQWKNLPFDTKVAIRDFNKGLREKGIEQFPDSSIDSDTMAWWRRRRKRHDHTLKKILQLRA